MARIFDIVQFVDEARAEMVHRIRSGDPVISALARR